MLLVVMCTGGGGNGRGAEVGVLGVVGAAPALVVEVVEENFVLSPLP